MSTTLTKDFYSATEVAKLLSYSRAWICRLTKAGKIEHTAMVANRLRLHPAWDHSPI